MQNMKRIRISVNLIHYFQDHRQLAKIFVKNDMQTIEDLQNHIINLFNIDKHFYLMCQNHYLPSVEDIHILNENDLVYVIPNVITEETTPIVKKKKKVPVNIETNVEVKKSKKKNKKPKENLEVVENHEESMETNCNEEGKVTKKKKKRQKQIDEENAKSSALNEELMETSNIVETVITTEVPKKKKRKSESTAPEANKSNVENSNSFEERNIITPSKNNVNETIIFRESNKFDAIFTNQNNVTTIIEHNDSEYNFVNDSRRKRRRCISPPAVFPEESGVEAEAIVENNKNPKKSIVQTVENISLNEHNELLEKLKHSPRQSYSLGDVLHFKNHTSSPATNEIQSILETSNRPALRSTRKQLSGVGKVLEFIKTERESDSISENNESTYPIPKRKRIRTRKRKPKNTESPAESIEHSEQPVFIPPKTIAAPKFHIKFEDNLVDTNANTVNGNHQYDCFLKPTSDNDFVHSTPLNKTVEIAKTGNSSGPRRISLVDINPEELPLMIEMPAVKNIILFKKLKLGSDYNPTISNYILAEIVEIAKNGDELHVKILEGHEELEDPIGGKFSFDAEDEGEYDYDKVQILERITLINPKIVDLGAQ